MAEAGLESPEAPVAVLMPSLSGAHVGPLHLADILGWGDMATQSSDDVAITGGYIGGVSGQVSFVNTSNLQATGAVSLSGQLLGFPGLPVAFNSGLPGVVWLDGTRLSVGADGSAPESLVDAINLMVSGAAKIEASSLGLEHVATTPPAPGAAYNVWANGTALNIGPYGTRATQPSLFGDFDSDGAALFSSGVFKVQRTVLGDPHVCGQLWHDANTFAHLSITDATGAACP